MELVHPRYTLIWPTSPLLARCHEQEPNLFDAAGRPWLKFARLLRGRSAQLKVHVKNNGLLEAAARIDMEPHPAFRLVEGSQVRHYGWIGCSVADGWYCC